MRKKLATKIEFWQNEPNLLIIAHADLAVFLRVESPCCLPRGLRSALLRKASVLRNWLLRKWDARQPSSTFSRSPLMLQSRVLLHCCVLRMCAETNFSHPQSARRRSQGA